MARRLGDELNEMRFQDNLSDTDVTLFYRMPTTKERVAYSNQCFKRTGKKLENRSVQTRMKYGLRILEGFLEGNFEVRIGGEWKVISSDPKSANYVSGWKEHVEEYASDIIQLLAIRVFDVSVQTPDPDEADEEEEDDDPGEDLDPNE